VSDAKRAAGVRAAEFVANGMVVGLGTGSTVWFTLQRLGERIEREGLEIRGVPTSLDTETKARELGIPLVPLAEASRIDVTIDGADEINPAFDMIKGGGGALLREKVVASITRREIIIADRTKLVDRLGIHFLLPVEVVPFARPVVGAALQGLGATSTVRMRGIEEVYRTDNGNEILDCRFPDGIPDPPGLEAQLARIPGIVECGLFVGLVDLLVVGEADGRTEIRERP